MFIAKDVPHQHTTGDAMGPSHQSEQLRSLVLPGGHHEKKRSKFWLSQFLFYFWYQGYFYDTKHSHIDTDFFFETNFCDCNTETIKRRDIRDQDVTLCVTSITDKKLNSLFSGRPVLLSRAWWWWWWWSSLWPLWSAPFASISTPDMPRWTRSVLSKFLRDGFTKKVAVLLDFVQMGGRGACLNFLSNFHKLYIESIWGWGRGVRYPTWFNSMF